MLCRTQAARITLTFFRIVLWFSLHSLGKRCNNNAKACSTFCKSRNWEKTIYNHIYKTVHTGQHTHEYPQAQNQFQRISICIHVWQNEHFENISTTGNEFWGQLIFVQLCLILLRGCATWGFPPKPDHVHPPGREVSPPLTPPAHIDPHWPEHRLARSPLPGS